MRRQRASVLESAPSEREREIDCLKPTGAERFDSRSKRGNRGRSNRVRRPRLESGYSAFQKPKARDPTRLDLIPFSRECRRTIAMRNRLTHAETHRELIVDTPIPDYHLACRRVRPNPPAVAEFTNPRRGGREFHRARLDPFPSGDRRIFRQISSSRREIHFETNVFVRSRSSRSCADRASRRLYLGFS